MTAEPQLRRRGETHVRENLGEGVCANHMLKTARLSLGSPALSLFEEIHWGRPSWGTGGRLTAEDDSF